MLKEGGSHSKDDFKAGVVLNQSRYHFREYIRYRVHKVAGEEEVRELLRTSIIRP